MPIPETRQTAPIATTRKTACALAIAGDGLDSIRGLYPCPEHETCGGTVTADCAARELPRLDHLFEAADRPWGPGRSRAPRIRPGRAGRLTPPRASAEPLVHCCILHGCA